MESGASSSNSMVSGQHRADVEKFGLCEFLFVISMAFALRFNRESAMLQDIGYIIIAFWVLYAVLIAVKEKERGHSYKYSGLTKVLIAPKIAIWCYGVLLVFLGLAWASAFSLGFTVIFAFALPLAGFFLFGRKTMDYLFWATAIMFCADAVYILATNGPTAVFQAIASLWDLNISNPFEHYSWVYSAAFFLVYYSFFDNKGRYHFVYLTFSVVLFVLGFKRILAGAVLVSMLLCFMLNRANEQRVRIVSKLINLSIFIASFVMIYGLFDGFLFDFIVNSGIEMKGRTLIWRLITGLGHFDPSYAGIGVNGVTYWLNSVTSSGHGGIGAAHNDILKMYLEIGFIGFFVWLAYFTVIIPKYIRDNFGNRASYVYSVFTLLMFFSYITGNPDTCFIAQFGYIGTFLNVIMNNEGPSTVDGDFRRTKGSHANSTKNSRMLLR